MLKLVLVDFILVPARMEENRAVALARRQLKLNSTRTSGAITTFNGATNGPAGGATRTSGANTTFNGATNGSAGGASYNHNAANANRKAYFMF